MLDDTSGLTIGGFIATLVALFLAVIAYFISRQPQKPGRRPPESNGSHRVEPPPGQPRPPPANSDDPYKWQ